MNEVVREKAQKLFERYNSIWKTHMEMVRPRGISGQTVHACDLCEEIGLFFDELIELKTALEAK